MTIPQAIANLQILKRQLGTIAANEMVNYALDNIRKETDIYDKPMKKRKAGSARNTGRGLLVDTGDGRRSITAKPTATGASLTANEYMEAHNTGVNKTVTVRAHSRTRKGRSESVQSFSRKMNLPARTFSGKSDAQTERIEKIIAQRIAKALT
jgi:phage gpG-like protein